MIDERPATDQREELHRFLDGLVSGSGSGTAALDPSLASTARRIHEVAASTSAISHRSNQEWETLMSMTISAPARLDSVLPPPRPTRTRLLPPIRPSGRFVAMFVAIVLFAVGGLALGLRPREADPVPSIAVAPLASQPSGAAAPVHGVSPDGVSYVQVPYADCDVTPVSYSFVMEIVLGDAYPFDSAPPFPEIASEQPGPNGTRQYGFDALPAGSAASSDVVDSAIRTYSLLLGCEDAPLRQASQFTAKGLARHYWESPSIYLQDGGADGGRLAALWSDNQGRQDVDPDHIGKLAPFFLYDFRILPNGDLAAYVSGVEGSPTANALPAFYDNAGYVVFAPHNGSWLIQEQFLR